MEFKPFPKMARFNRDIIITEKLDGTNAQVVIFPFTEEEAEKNGALVSEDGSMLMRVGSRSRYLTREQDNFGFFKWVEENKDEMFKLGEGQHFGEWWGKGIQRGYGMEERKFSLFNVSRWKDERPACCDVVPTLYEGPMSQGIIDDKVADLIFHGSVAASGFMKPEGIIVFHTAANIGFKITCENDEKPKGQVGG